jgi:hypothetical protein
MIQRSSSAATNQLHETVLDLKEGIDRHAAAIDRYNAESTDMATQMHRLGIAQWVLAVAMLIVALIQVWIAVK